MSPNDHRSRDEMERRYPLLRQFLGGYLHEDSSFFHGSPQQAVDTALSEYPLAMRQQVRQELLAVLESIPDDVDLRAALNDGLGVNLYFKKASEARAFGKEVERKLLVSIRTESSGKWSG